MILQQISHDSEGVPIIEIDPASNDIVRPSLTFHIETDSRIPQVVITCDKTEMRIDEVEFDGFINRFFDGIREHNKYQICISGITHEISLTEDERRDLLNMQETCRQKHPKF